MDPAIKVIIDHSKCTGCGKCVTDCLHHTIGLANGVARVLSDDCLKCGHCLAICPQGAIQMTGLDDEILEKSSATRMLDADALKTHLKLRRSIRRYKKTPVEKEKIAQIVEAGRLTPTGSNRQNVRYIVVQSGIDELEDAVIEQYRALAEQALSPTESASTLTALDPRIYQLKRGLLFYNAPALILVVSDSSVNASLAAMSMELMAEALGLGTVYVGLFAKPASQNDALRCELGLTPEENIVVCLALGYPAVTYLRSAPKKPANIVWR